MVKGLCYTYPQCCPLSLILPSSISALPQESPTCRCSTPKGRNLVVCVDGTAQRFKEKMVSTYFGVVWLQSCFLTVLVRIPMSLNYTVASPKARTNSPTTTVALEQMSSHSGITSASDAWCTRRCNVSPLGKSFFYFIEQARAWVLNFLGTLIKMSVQHIIGLQNIIKQGIVSFSSVGLSCRQ